MFADREDAGKRLAQRLADFKGSDLCVLALPRGGVPVAFEVAKALQAPLDLVLVRKIGVPFEPELAMGAVVDGAQPELVLNDEIVSELGIPEEIISEASARELKEIERRRKLYLGERPRADVSGKTALIIDDGIATGATIRAALRATRRANPKRLIVAVPVAPAETVSALRAEADDVICLEAYDDFGAIGLYYMNFAQVGDDTVRDLIARSAEPAAVPAP